MAIRNDPTRLWSRAEPVGDCLVWQGARAWGGYGLLMWNGERRRRAHRVAYELTHGPIPIGLHVLHRCDNPPCIRPEHLFLGTQTDNMYDRIAKGRGMLRPPVRDQKGTHNPAATLDDRSVRAIRSLAVQGVLHRIIASAFGVNKRTIGNVVRRDTWGHI